MVGGLARSNHVADNTASGAVEVICWKFRQEKIKRGRKRRVPEVSYKMSKMRHQLGRTYSLRPFQNYVLTYRAVKHTPL